MPRETITDITTQGFYAELFWRRKPGLDTDDQGTSSGFVQLASVNALSPFHFPDVETEDHFEAGEKFDGWRVTLDEAGIDRLIKALHKAKRQAFGEPQGGVLPPGTHRFVEDRAESEVFFSGQGPRPVRVIGDNQVASAEQCGYIPETDRSRRINERILGQD